MNENLMTLNLIFSVVLRQALKTFWLRIENLKIIKFLNKIRTALTKDEAQVFQSTSKIFENFMTGSRLSKSSNRIWDGSKFNYELQSKLTNSLRFSSCSKSEVTWILPWRALLLVLTNNKALINIEAINKKS